MLALLDNPLAKLNIKREYILTITLAKVSSTSSKLIFTNWNLRPLVISNDEMNCSRFIKLG